MQLVIEDGGSWALHSILVYTQKSESQLDIQVFDHWSADTCQDAWFTASSLHAVIESLEVKPDWKLEKPNLQLILTIPKFTCDKSLCSIGVDINEGVDIENAIQGICGTSVTHLKSERKREINTNRLTIEELKKQLREHGVDTDISNNRVVLAEILQNKLNNEISQQNMDVLNTEIIDTDLDSRKILNHTLDFVLPNQRYYVCHFGDDQLPPINPSATLEKISIWKKSQEVRNCYKKLNTHMEKILVKLYGPDKEKRSEVQVAFAMALNKLRNNSYSFSEEEHSDKEYLSGERGEGEGSKDYESDKIVALSKICKIRAPSQ
ncbi:hypothetical protein C1646_774364 [Rhizophagus diaphanus]|nr:hypothetical protein C1646_774364 [Rhizophagus diaphanus] [Rhizophagus sp. MUCL 43196]